jgi:hypothetical protein
MAGYGGGASGISMSMSASSGARGGSQGSTTNNALSEGAWITGDGSTSNGASSQTGSTNLNQKTLIYAAIAAAAFWYYKNHKTA